MSQHIAETAGRRIAGQRASLPQALFASVVIGITAGALTYRFLRSA
jgi:hypothetical protein